jgi:hypothetical protein
MVAQKSIKKNFFSLMLVLMFLPVSFLFAGDDESISKDDVWVSSVYDSMKDLIGSMKFEDPIKEALTKKLPDDIYAGILKLALKNGYNKHQLLKNSLLYPILSDSLQSNPFVQKFILPSETAILAALILSLPKIVTTVFCDGILQEAANRFMKKIHNMIFDSQLVITTKIPQGLHLDDLILEPVVKQRLLVSVAAFSNILKNKGRAQLNGLLFYGLPGTGKTEAARVMASMISKKNKILYFELSGDVLARASRDELRDLIESFKACRRPAIVLIDECEKFLLDRRLTLRKGEALPEGLSEWLNFTSKPSKNIQFIYTTNYRDKIEKAMLRRVHPVEFLLPTCQTREHLLEVFFNKYFMHDAFYNAAELTQMRLVFNQEFFAEVAEKLVYVGVDKQGNKIVQDRFSPANIENLINDVKNFSIAVNGRGVATRESFNVIVEQAIHMKHEEIDTENRLFGDKFLAQALKYDEISAAA